MSSPVNKPLLREPQRIDSINELHIARKRAAVNATQDKQRLKASINRLKADGPQVLLKEVVLPAAAIGLAIWGAAKAINALTSSDDDPAVDARSTAAPSTVSPGTATPESVHVVRERRSTPRRLATYLPVALNLAKMGVNYLEKSGHEIPPLVHAILSGTDAKSSQDSSASKASEHTLS